MDGNQMTIDDYLDSSFESQIKLLEFLKSKYVIISQRNEKLIFWAPNGRGYVDNLSNAGLFDYAATKQHNAPAVSKITNTTFLHVEHVAINYSNFVDQLFSKACRG